MVNLKIQPPVQLSKAPRTSTCTCPAHIINVDESCKAPVIQTADGAAAALGCVR